MNENQLAETFSPDTLARLFPAERTNAFFDALFGDAEEGAFDIGLTFSGGEGEELKFELQLKQRPGKCLACHLTHGIPNVFLRHPIIDLQGLVREIGSIAGGDGEPEWELGRTREVSRKLHVVPLTVRLNS